MEPSEILDWLRDNNIFPECYILHSEYKGYYRGKDGYTSEVTIKIFDAGHGHPNRYHARAYSEDGKMATGNSGPTIEVVLATMHWFNLDNKP